MLPPCKNTERKIVDVNGKPMLLFHSGWSIFSNFYRQSFTVEKIEYKTVEQFYQSEKTRYFGDFTQTMEIMKTVAPSKCKELGRKVKNFSLLAWSEVADKVMLEGVKEIFFQNQHLREKLLETGNSTIVEATPFDIYWGSGLGIDNEDNRDTGRWRGYNKLGEILMFVREMLKEQL